MSDDPKKFVEITRLAYESCSDVRKFGGKAGQEDEWRRRGAEQLPRTPEQFPAVHPVHAKVADDERGRRFPHHAECSGASRRGSRHVAGALQHIDDAIAIVLVIVDDQNPFRHRCQARRVHPQPTRKRKE
jgi:hypothetical protein